MKDFITQNKTFLAVILGTIALLFGGVFLFSRNSTTRGNKVSTDILIPKSSYQTNSKAPVTVVEFGDYQCPACGAYHPIVKQLISDLPDKVNFVFRDFPLSQHANAPIASYAVLAAGIQGKYWQMHDKIYETQPAWSTSTDAKSIFVSYAKDLNLDLDKFKKDLDSSVIKDIVTKGTADGNLIGINATPTFFINGVKIQNPASIDEFKKLIEDAAKNSPLSQTSAPEAYHIHFDIKVYVNGSPLNLALDKYQSTSSHELNPFIHLHDGNGKVVHVHKVGMKIKDLVDSWKLTLSSNTLAYVNGKRVANILDYVPQDLDQILIGSSNVSSVSNDACIYSLKCPERGTPPTEKCVGGLGTDCKD